MVTCTDPATGRVILDRERLGKEAGGDYFASPIMADGHIYVCSTRGVISVIQSGGDSLKVLVQNSLNDPVLATPAIVGNRIYIRSASALWAFGE